MNLQEFYAEMKRAIEEAANPDLATQTVRSLRCTFKEVRQMRLNMLNEWRVMQIGAVEE